jgi:hypothetical protein
MFRFLDDLVDLRCGRQPGSTAGSNSRRCISFSRHVNQRLADEAQEGGSNRRGIPDRHDDPVPPVPDDLQRTAVHDRCESRGHRLGDRGGPTLDQAWRKRDVSAGEEPREIGVHIVRNHMDLTIQLGREVGEDALPRRPGAQEVSPQAWGRIIRSTGRSTLSGRRGAPSRRGGHGRGRTRREAAPSTTAVDRARPRALCGRRRQPP